MPQAIEQFIPDPRLAEAYVNRTIWGYRDFEVFDWARKERVNLLLKGPTQAAKTTALRAYAAERQIPVCTVDVNAALDPGLTLGSYTQQDGEWIWQDGNLVFVLRQDEGVIFLDECNMAHPKVMAAYHSLGDNRRHIALPQIGEVVKAGENVLIAATMNPGYIGTTPLGQAFNARFFHVPWDYDKNVEAKLLAPSVCSFGRKLRESDTINTPVSTAMLMRFQETVGQMGYEFALSGMRASFSDEEADGIKYALDGGLDADIKRDLT